MAFSLARHFGFSLGTAVSSPPTSVNGFIPLHETQTNKSNCNFKSVRTNR